MIEINGEQYEQIDRSQPKIPRMASMSLMMGLMSAGMVGTSNYSRERPSVNIPEEYALILEKKSKLCRADRDWVVAMFKRNYRKVTPLSTEKGGWQGNCNRTACQKPGAVYYNHSTRKYYCHICARMINEMNPESHTIYGHELCTKGKHDDNS